MSRFLLALNVQSHFAPQEPLVQGIIRVAEQMPCAASLFIGNENKVPFGARGMRPGPESDACRIPTQNIFNQNGYNLPPELVEWLSNNGATEVLVTGGFHDERILAAGFNLFDAGLKPVLVPNLCYGNNWFEHTVTINLWERSIGQVVQSVIELGLQA